MNREMLERIARDRLADVPLPAEDWEALLPQIEGTLAVVSRLDGLPLEAIEPAPIYTIIP